MMIKAAERILNSDKICRNYSDLNFGVTFFGTPCIIFEVQLRPCCCVAYSQQRATQMLITT